jgi:hypothetical protein
VIFLSVTSIRLMKAGRKARVEFSCQNQLGCLPAAITTGLRVAHLHAKRSSVAVGGLILRHSKQLNYSPEAMAIALKMQLASC